VPSEDKSTSSFQRRMERHSGRPGVAFALGSVNEYVEALRADLERLVDPQSRGDAESPLRWTTKSVRRLRDVLRTGDIGSRSRSWRGCCGARLQPAGEPQGA
jgi:hypothetical protein